jgi:3-hydroxybutyrate dehydrogenase
MQQKPLANRTALSGPTRALAVGRDPTGRFVAVESVAAAAVFLCSEAARDITGANPAIDGGWSAA